MISYWTILLRLLLALLLGSVIGLAREQKERDRVLDERIANLVSAVGELIRRDSQRSQKSN